MDETEVNQEGGKQALLEGWPTLVPSLALLEVAKVMKRGAKYGKNNWHRIPLESDGQYAGELDHAIMHYLNFMCHRGNPLEELSHLAARSLMALDQWIREHRQPEGPQTRMPEGLMRKYMDID